MTLRIGHRGANGGPEQLHYRDDMQNAAQRLCRKVACK